jgi:hypothetical protein
MRQRLDTGGSRLRLELDLDRAARASAEGTLPEAIINRALRVATQSQRMHLLWALLDEPSDATLSEVRAIWLLQAAGIDPVPLLESAQTAPTTLPPILGGLPATVHTVTLDGASAFALELERRLRPVGLRDRLSLPSRP